MSLLFISVSALLPVLTTGFSTALFQETPSLQTLAPSSNNGVDIELPDFVELFERIRQVSPLAKSVIDNRSGNGKGFAGLDYSKIPFEKKWKTLESHKNKPLHKIEKIDNFMNINAPLLRFKSSLKGPCLGEPFADYIMQIDKRKQWDNQIDNVFEIYPINDLDAANIAMGFGKYGDCSRLGIGYCLTKANLGISPREQLTLCGIQDFNDGSCIIWGVEMEEWHDNLLPAIKNGSQRPQRAKSHIFATTLTPTSDNSFDVEYVIQLEAGGKLPTWLTTPVMLESIKAMFNKAQHFYQGDNGELEAYLQECKARDNFADRHSILMTP